MRITRKQAEKYPSFEEYLEKRIGKEEKEALEKEAEVHLAILKEMQESISAEVAKFMAKEGIGFNELTRRLDTSTRQTSKIVKGEANLTLETIADLAEVMGKRPLIKFR